MTALVITSRWLHVIAACLAIGGLFFIRFILPAGLSVLEPDLRLAVLVKTRRVFKMLIHSAILLLLLTGAYNTFLMLDKYKLDPAHLHPILGIHILLALIAFTIALYVLAGPTPRPSQRKLMAINFCILLVTVAAASTLKWAREKAIAEHATTTEHPISAQQIPLTAESR